MRGLHVAAGLVGLMSGAVALYAAKGAALHRKSGMIFVYSMLFMSASGALIAALKSGAISVVAGTLTFYLVATSLLTVRRGDAGFHRIDAFGLLVALAIGAAAMTFGVLAANSPTGRL